MEDFPKVPASASYQRRVNACVGACIGIPTEALEAHVLTRLFAALVRVAEPAVREILDEISPARRERKSLAPPSRQVREVAHHQDPSSTDGRIRTANDPPASVTPLHCPACRQRTGKDLRMRGPVSGPGGARFFVCPRCKKLLIDRGGSSRRV